MLAFICFLLAALVGGLCFFVPELLRLRLVAAAVGLIGLGLAVSAYPH